MGMYTSSIEREDMLKMGWVGSTEEFTQHCYAFDKVKIEELWEGTLIFKKTFQLIFSKYDQCFGVSSYINGSYTGSTSIRVNLLTLQDLVEFERLFNLKTI